jgi:hypothetical protein
MKIVGGRYRAIYCDNILAAGTSDDVTMMESIRFYANVDGNAGNSKRAGSSLLYTKTKVPRRFTRSGV